MSRTERKASEMAGKMKELATELVGGPVVAAWIVMPTGTYASGSIKQYYETDETGDFAGPVQVDASLPIRDQLLLAVTDVQVRHFVVHPTATFGRLKWKFRSERPPFDRHDLEVDAEHPDGLVRFSLREPSTGREAHYETWTTYGAAPYVQAFLRDLKARPGEDDAVT